MTNNNKIENIDYQLKKINLDIKTTELQIKQKELASRDKKQKEKNIDRCFQHIQTIVSAISAIAIPIILGFGINYFSSKNEQDKTAANLIEIIASEEQSLYAKQAALSALNKFNLLDDDVLYDLTYRIDDFHYSAIPIGESFVKERIKKPKMLDYPLGAIDLPKEKKHYLKNKACADKCDNKYRIAGWGVSKNKVSYLSIFIDYQERFKLYYPGILPKEAIADKDKIINSQEFKENYLLVITDQSNNNYLKYKYFKPAQREDVLRNYFQYKKAKHNNPNYLGFDFYIPPELITGNSHKLTIKLTDSEYLARDIFSREMCFQESCE